MTLNLDKKLIVRSVLVFVIVISIVLGHKYYLNHLPADKRIYHESLVWDAFKKIALGSEDEKIEKKVVKKWVRPIRILVKGDSGEDFLPIIEGSVNEIKNHIFVEMDIVSDSANVVVIFSEQMDLDIYGVYKNAILKISKGNDFFKNYEKLKEKDRNPLDGFVYYVGDSDFNMITSFIFVSSHIDNKMIKDHIQSHFFSTLGLIETSSSIGPSIFSNVKYGLSHITHQDWLLLRILYHSEVKTGMNVNDLKKIFSKIYKECLEELLREVDDDAI